jgi:hypothetical protein
MKTFFTGRESGLNSLSKHSDGIDLKFARTATIHLSEIHHQLQQEETPVQPGDF